MFDEVVFFVDFVMKAFRNHVNFPWELVQTLYVPPSRLVFYDVSKIVQLLWEEALHQDDHIRETKYCNSKDSQD